MFVIPRKECTKLTEKVDKRKL